MMLILLTLMNLMVLAATNPLGPAGSTFIKLSNWEEAELATFVDMNADRRTDTVIYSRANSQLDVLMEPNAKEARQELKLPNSHGPKRMTLTKIPDPIGHDLPVRSVVAADFFGNSIPDFLVLTSKDKEGPFHAYILFGDTTNTTYTKSKYVGEFAAQPLICDLNGDMIADLFGEFTNGTRVAVLGGPVFDITPYSESTGRWSKLGYAGFAAIGLDKSSSVVVLTNDESAHLEVFLPTTPRVTNPTIRKINLPIDLQNAVKYKKLGKFVFGDFDMSSEVKLLLTGCPTGVCSELSVVYLCSLKTGGTCDKLEVNWKPEGYTKTGDWFLAEPVDRLSDFSLSSLIGPSLGDADLDGYPDIALGLKNNGDSQVYPAILHNLRGHSKSGGKISFQAHLLPGIDLESNQHLRQIAFFDQEEDGILDLFISYTESSTSGIMSALYVQQLPSEAYFLKVMITSGLCGSQFSCPAHRLPYGLPTYGNRADYETQGVEGQRIHSAGVFVSTSCCGALQLPFIIFGFADFATYIDVVPISIPAPSGVMHSRALTFIVPNAQVVVIPFPPNNPAEWQTKLFLEPLYDMKVIYVAITLVVTCVVLIVVITVLQCFEVRSDRQEKLQEATRFHFDAM